MLDRTVVAFDIETMPDPALGRRLGGHAGTDAEVVHAMVAQRRAETNGATEYPQHPWHRVVCVCAAVLWPETGRVELRALGGAAMDERSHLTGFYRLFSELGSPRLVSWNGAGFDVPILRYRAMLHGVAAPEFHRVSGDRKWNHYHNRYHDLHTDLMDVLSNHGASMRVGLGTLGGVLGLPGKSFLEGPVYEHVLAGEEARVVEYCKSDTLHTLLLFLAWAHHTGALDAAGFARAVGGARAAVAASPFPAWREVEAALSGWPAWLTTPAPAVARRTASRGPQPRRRRTEGGAPGSPRARAAPTSRDCPEAKGAARSAPCPQRVLSPRAPSPVLRGEGGRGSRWRWARRSG